MNCSTPYFLTCICHSTMSSHSIGAPSLRRPMLLLCQRSLIFSNPCLFSVSVYVDKIRGLWLIDVHCTGCPIVWKRKPVGGILV